MKGELVSLAIVQGYVDLPVNGQNPFLWKVKEFASKHGFEFHLMELPGNNKAYSAMLIRDDLLLDCTSETVSAMEGFDPLRYGFAFHRNVFKHNKLESDDPYRPEVDRLVTDFQVMMKPVGAVTITPSKSK